mmetsp:Transcript_144612/g.252085  ORF Transcript_144612/g.252085 Transcript_144612/m.252085 type:complete len:217 (+) Transcript_144612:598-1248(+)
MRLRLVLGFGGGSMHLYKLAHNALVRPLATDRDRMQQELWAAGNDLRDVRDRILHLQLGGCRLSPGGISVLEDHHEDVHRLVVGVGEGHLLDPGLVGPEVVVDSAEDNLRTKLFGKPEDSTAHCWNGDRIHLLLIGCSQAVVDALLQQLWLLVAAPHPDWPHSMQHPFARQIACPGPYNTACLNLFVRVDVGITLLLDHVSPSITNCASKTSIMLQ